MKIKYLGHSCFFLDGNVKIVTDPFDGIGYPMEKQKCDYVFVSHNHHDHNATHNIPNCKLMTNEDESGLDTLFVKCFHDEVFGKKRGENLAVLFKLNNISFCHLGDVGETVSNKFDKFIGVDVLFIPVGGRYTIDYKQAIEFVDYIKPKIVIPMHYNTPRSNVGVAACDDFITNCLLKVNYVGQTIELDKDKLPKSAEVYLFDTKSF